MIKHPIDYLEILWQKPESSRRKIAAVAIGLCMAIIIGIWLMTFSIVPVAPREPASATILGPFSTFWSYLKDLINRR